MRPFHVLRLSKVLKSYKNSAIFQAFLCPTLPSERPPESVGEPLCIVNLVPANLRKDAAPWIRRSMWPPYSRSPGTPSATNQVFLRPDNTLEKGLVRCNSLILAPRE